MTPTTPPRQPTRSELATIRNRLIGDFQRDGGPKSTALQDLSNIIDRMPSDAANDKRRRELAEFLVEWQNLPKIDWGQTQPESAPATAPKEAKTQAAPPPVTCCGCGRTLELDFDRWLTAPGKDGRQHHLCAGCEHAKVSNSEWQSHLAGNGMCPMPKPATTPELKPCPFCGETGAKMRQNNETDYFVWCPTCGAESYPWSDSESAVATWNRRTP